VSLLINPGSQQLASPVNDPIKRGGVTCDE
jgi:hypothetical protein